MSAVSHEESVILVQQFFFLQEKDFIGEIATGDGEVNPQGSVKLRGATWKARTNQSTPISDGQECKVVKIEGIILEVEPL